jgi:hypothetical protein
LNILNPESAAMGLRVGRDGERGVARRLARADGLQEGRNAGIE